MAYKLSNSGLWLKCLISNLESDEKLPQFEYAEGITQFVWWTYLRR